MRLLAVYIYGKKEPCNGSTEAPYTSQLCNDIEYGLLDSEDFMRPGDRWDRDNTLWSIGPNDSGWASANSLEAGNLYFVDTENEKFLFKLPKIFVSRTRVREIAKLCWKLKYKEEGGTPGYIVNDPENPTGETWYPLPALAEEQFRSKYGNPFISILEMLANTLDSLIDSLLPGLANLVPWWLYVAGAGYTAVKAKQSFPKGKFDISKVDAPTYLYGLGSAFLVFRAYKSYEAKDDRKKGIAGPRKRRVIRKPVN